MKRTIAIATLIAALAAGAYAADTLDSFKTNFTSVAGDLATSLAVDSSLGANWSDAYVGAFPHLGAGVYAGAVFTGASSSAALSALGVSLPAELSSYGLPVPALGGSFKIGIPFLPIDVGVKGMYLPSSISDGLLSSSGVSATLTSLGVQVRYAIIKQNLILPNLSIGAAYNYQQGNLSASIGDSQSYTVTTDQGTTTISASKPKVAIDWKGNTFDFTAQVSKQLLFLIPYLGAGATFGSSTVNGGVASTLSTDYAGGISALNSWSAANGGPTISDSGFTYTVTESSPVYRVYGGLSFRILVVDLDLQAIYLPFNGDKLGASLTARVQL